MTGTLDMLLDHALVHRLAWTLIHSLWLLIAAALLAAGLLAALRRYGSSARYVAACTMLLVMLSAPIATFVAIAPQVSRTSAGATRVEAGLLATIPTETDALQDIALPNPTPRQAPPRLLPWLVPLYFTGIFVLSLLHLGGWLQVQRMRRTHVKHVDASWRAVLAQLSMQLRVNRHVQLLESTLMQVPAVVGLFQPVILLPASVLTGLTPQQVKSILAHELAHVRRHDYLVNLIQTAIETLLFYHPAVWWLSDRIRQEREHCCDDLAAAVACADRLQYAGALAALEELRAVPPRLALAVRGGGSLLYRIRRLLDVPEPSPRRCPSLLAAVAAVACVLLAAFTLHAHAKDDDAPRKNDDAAIAGTREEPASAVRPEDLKPVAEDYTIIPGDLLTVSIMDIVDRGKEMVRTMRVPASGVIRLPHLTDTLANGLTEHQLEQLIIRKYTDEGIIQRPTISITVTEPRGRSFSILGRVNKPGQYQLLEADFRLIDAIAQAGGTKDGNLLAKVIRQKPEPRIIDVPLNPLLDGNLDLNVVIRGGDKILVTAADSRQVRLVVGKDAIAFEGAQTTWEELPNLLKKIPEAQRGSTVLELAVESNDLTVGQFFDAQARVSQVVKDFGLSSVSFVGVHPLDSKGGQPPARAEGEVYLSGRVKQPGAYALGARKITVKQLVVAGQLDEANAEPRVTVMRRSADGKTERHVMRDVPLQSILDGRAEDPHLQANDVVFVKDATEPDRPK